MLLSKTDMEKLNLEKLDEETKKEIIEIKDGIQLNVESISNLGKLQSSKISQFSSDLLKTVQLKDTPEIEGLLTGLMDNINAVNPESLLENKKGFFAKLFKTEKIKNFAMKYENVHGIIDEVSCKLQTAQYSLKKDVEMCEQYLELNREYIDALDKYIIAGKLKYNEEKENLEKERLSLDVSDALASEELSIKEDQLNRLDRRLYDLNLLRVIAIQNIPQMRLIQSGDSVLIEKIDNSISTAIPLWESQMVVAIGMLRQQNGLKVQESVSETTNRLLKQNANMLKTNSVQIAKQLENGIVDIDTLKDTTKQLVSTVNEIKKVRKEGVEKREKAISELMELQSELNGCMLENNG